MQTILRIFLIFFSAIFFSANAFTQTIGTNRNSLESKLFSAIRNAPGTVGIAYISHTDTVLINNGVHYPMMSVFKLHQALAVSNRLTEKGCSLDSVLNISASELDPNTWSPMLKQYTSPSFEISVGQLLDFAIISSDNNASNLLFQHIVSPSETDSYIRSVAADTTFAICHSEAEMKQNHALSYNNYSSPLSAALIIKQVFTSDIVNPSHCSAILNALSTVTTGANRLGAPFINKKDILFAHKTGSGYRNERGELVAFNDVAYIRLPDNTDYALAVMIRDFNGTEEQASDIMASISEIIYAHLLNNTNMQH